MCDDDINPGLMTDWRLSRRAFVASGLAASAFAKAVHAAEKDVVETDVTVTTPDGEADAVLLHPAGEGPWPAVLMWPDIVGLRPVFRDMGRRLAAAGYTVLVPNPFYRSAKAPVVGPEFSFADAEGRQKLFGYRGAMSDAGIDTDAAAYLAFLDAQAQTDSAKKAGVQGYCMGGPLSFRTAAAVPDRIGAVGSFHGGGLVTDEPSSPHLLVEETSAAYLICVAQNDDARAPDDKVVLTETFEAAGLPHSVEVYPADHGWCVPGSQAYDNAAAEKAWAELLKLYGMALA